jgi:hypothetical protein
MTMHLAHPALTLGGKKRGKPKFRNAEEARRARELAESWDNLKAKWAAQAPKVKTKSPSVLTTTRTAVRDTGPRIPSLNGGRETSAAVKQPAKVYTGTKVLGIATMHKSNAVPVFAAEEAKEISQMRRG